MKTPWKGFDSRTNIILTNFPTVREILKMAEPRGDLYSQWNQFMWTLPRELRKRIPSLGKWQIEEGDAEFGFYPGKLWKVMRGESPIQITVGWDFDIKTNENPWVSLWVPEEWGKYSRFVSDLDWVLKVLKEEGWEDEEDGWVTWKWIPIEDCGKGKTFRTAEYIKAISVAIKRLVVIRPEIDRVLRSLKR